jgi:hypothetical protein
MTSSIYTTSIPVFKQMLGGLKGVLAKAEAHAAAKNIDPNALLQARLFPDMFPLLRQVQVASDFAKSVSARLAGVEVPKIEDKETTFAELQARIDTILAFIEGLGTRSLMKPPRARSSRRPARPRKSVSPASRTCSITACRTSSSTPRRHTPSCATTAWKSARRITSAAIEPRAGRRCALVARRARSVRPDGGVGQVLVGAAVAAVQLP